MKAKSLVRETISVTEIHLRDEEDLNWNNLSRTGKGMEVRERVGSSTVSMMIIWAGRGRCGGKWCKGIVKKNSILACQLGEWW